MAGQERGAASPLLLYSLPWTGGNALYSRIALFIDGGYLDHVLKWHGKAKIDYSKLAQQMAQGHLLLRTYYYHCLPHQSSYPSLEEKDYFSHAQRFFKRLNRLGSFTVREGKLAFRGIDERGFPVFEQKRIDVMLATDLVMHSTKKLITHAALLTGDSDFLPALQIAQSEGVHITLYYSDGNDEIRPHDELLDLVDDRKVIDAEFLHSIRRE
ncbi:NYN domain-containing protein [Geobacillus subterraneus]|nr:NYN domain-containing protein [Geobacillus subterraneus]